MKRLIISLELSHGNTWADVQRAIAMNTPVNTSLVVGDESTGSPVYMINGYGVHGHSVSYDDYESN